MLKFVVNFNKNFYLNVLEGYTFLLNERFRDLSATETLQYKLKAQ
jgi:hypothetical protein